MVTPGETSYEENDYGVPADSNQPNSLSFKSPD